MKTKILIILLILVIFFIVNYFKSTKEHFNENTLQTILDILCRKIKLESEFNNYNLCNFFTFDSFNIWAKNSEFNLENLTEEKIKNSDYYKNLQIIIDEGIIFRIFDLKDIFNSFNYYFNDNLNENYLDYNIINNDTKQLLQNFKNTREITRQKNTFLTESLKPIVVNLQTYNNQTLHINNPTIDINNTIFEIDIAKYNSIFNLRLENLNYYKETNYPEYHRYFFYMMVLPQVMNVYTNGRNVVILNNYSYKFQNDNQNQEENFNYSKNNNKKDNFTDLRKSIFFPDDMSTIYYPDTNDIKIFGDEGIILKNDILIYENDIVSIPYNYFPNLPKVEDIQSKFSGVYEKMNILLEKIKNNSDNYPFFHLIYDLREENHILIYLNISDNLNAKNNEFIEFNFKWKLIFLNKKDDLYTINKLKSILRNNIQDINRRILPKEEYFERFLNDFYINDLRLLAKNFNFSTNNGGDSFYIEEDKNRNFWGGENVLSDKKCRYKLKIGFSHTLFPYMQYYTLINLICINKIIIENKYDDYETLPIFTEFNIDLLKNDPYVEPYDLEKSYINLFIDLIENDIKIVENKFMEIIDEDMGQLEKLEIEDNGNKFYFYKFKNDNITKMIQDNPLLNQTINIEENIIPLPIDEVQPFTNYSEVIENFSNKCIDKKSNSNEEWKDVNLIDTTTSWNCQDYKDNGWCVNGNIVPNKYEDVNNNDLGKSAQDACCVCGGGDNIPADSNTIPAPSNSIQADSNTIQAVSDNIPADSNSIPADSNTIPAPSTSIQAVSDLFSDVLVENINKIIKDNLDTDTIEFSKNTNTLQITIPNKSLSDLAEKDKILITGMIKLRVKDTYGNKYKDNQIIVEFKSGSIKIIVRLIGIEEANILEDAKKTIQSEAQVKNYVQYKPSGKNGMFIPTTHIDLGNNDLNKQFIDSSHII